MNMSTPMRLPPNALIKNPAGTWSFVGAVSPELAYVTRDGGTPTAQQLEDARSFGPGIVGLRSRVWQTREEAELALEAIHA